MRAPAQSRTGNKASWAARSRAPSPMRAVRSVSLLTALVVAIPLPAHANVFGHDDRRPLRAADGFDAVGHIACDGSTRLPVGTLVDHPALPDTRGHDLVVTVAHAFVGARNEVQERCEFRPGGDAAAAAPILRIALGTLDPGRAWHHDWAVAVVGARLSVAYGALPLRTITEEDLAPLSARGARYALVGKNGERPHMLVSDSCGPVPKLHWHHGYFNPAEFNHDCDMIAGWSGGPLVLIDEGVRAVVAVNATELNGIIHRHGDPFHPRMFANTAIRLDGDFLAAVERLAAMDAPAPWAEPDPDAPARLAVMPQGCMGEPQTLARAVTGDVVALATELALVPAANVADIC